MRMNSEMTKRMLVEGLGGKSSGKGEAEIALISL